MRHSLLKFSACLIPLLLAAAFGAAPGAWAGTTATPAPPLTATATIPGPDGLTDGAIFIRADQVEQNNDNALVALGHVEARYQDRVINADTLRYDPDSRHTIVEGHAIVSNPDGSLQFADKLDLYDPDPSAPKKTQVTTGSGHHVASSFTDGTKIFSSEMTRVNADVTRMNQALYTPCQLCVVNHRTQPPVWSIKAESVTQDKSRNIVFYRNAVVMVKDVPVFYFPVLWHADPSVKSASGFLMPNFDFSGRRGNSYTQPYLWQMSPYQSLLIEPRFNTKVNPFLNLTWQRKFYSGLAVVRLGYANDQFFDNSGRHYAKDASGTPLPGNGKSVDVGYILANGSFRIDHNWRWSFTGEHVFDHGAANLFDRYKIHKSFVQRGEFTAPSRQLISQFDLTRQSDDLFFNIATIEFQNMTLDPVKGFETLNSALQVYRPIAASSDLQPRAEPLVELRYAPKSKFLGGHINMAVTGVALIRKAYVGYPIAPVLADGTSGFDSNRVSGEFSWQRDMTTSGGIKISPFLSARHDHYQVSNLTSQGLKAEVNRNLSTAGVNLAYPLFQRFKGYEITLSPQIQAAVSPRSKSFAALANEDSQSFVFDQTSLFKPDRAPGFDLYEGGKRLNIGMGAGVRFDHGLRLDTLVGRAFRDQVETDFLQRVARFDPAHISSTDFIKADLSGLALKKSDWIWDSSFDTGHGLYGYSRINLDSQNNALRHAEAGFSVSKPNTLLTLRYVIDRTAAVYDSKGPAPTYQLVKVNGLRDSSTTLYARHFFTKTWGAAMRINRDNLTGQYHQSEISLIYRDDCTWLEGVYQYEDSYYTATNHRKPAATFTVRLNLATFSSNGVEFTDIR